MEKARTDEIRLEAEEHAAINGILRKEHAARMKRYEVELEESTMSKAAATTEENSEKWKKEYLDLHQTESKLRTQIEQFETESQRRTENTSLEHEDLISSHEEALQAQHDRLSKSLEEAKREMEEKIASSRSLENEMQRKLRSLQDNTNMKTQESAELQKSHELSLEKIREENLHLSQASQDSLTQLNTAREKHEEAMRSLSVRYEEKESELRDKLTEQNQKE